MTERARFFPIKTFLAILIALSVAINGYLSNEIRTYRKKNADLSMQVQIYSALNSYLYNELEKAQKNNKSLTNEKIIRVNTVGVK